MRDHLLNFLNKYKYHFLIWLAYFNYEIAASWLVFDKVPAIEINLYIFIFYIPLFYFHANVLLKYILESSNKVLRYSLAFWVLIELMLYVSIKYQCDLIFFKYADPSVLDGYNFNLTNLSNMIYRFIYFTCYSTGYYFLIRTRNQRQLVEEMEQQELKDQIREKEIKNELVLTQNAFLRSQINPDFLISTLDYLYHKTLSSAPKAAESILSLSDIMQYALSKEASTGFVKLDKEISLIENFLLLHQARQVQKAQLKFSYNHESLSIKFIPLVLMTLTENILKHGRLDDPKKPAEIKITYENSMLRIQTSNRQAINSNIPSHGIGLKNIKERLLLAYGNKVIFNYHLDSKFYFHTVIEVQI